MPTERTLRDTTRRVIGMSDKYAAFRHVVSTFMFLPALRGLWTANHQAASGNWYDWTKNNLELTVNGSPEQSYDDLKSYIIFDGTTDYYNRASEAAISITGAETHIHAAVRGLTLGAWIYSTSSTTSQYIMAKWLAAAQLSYLLSLRGDLAGDPVQFHISDDGANSDNVTGAGYTASRWHFVVGRFNVNDTNEELAVWRDNVKTTAATARTAIHGGTADLYFGKYEGGASDFLAGRKSIAFLCAAALSDDMIGALFQQSRALYGV